jgi:hypothetical protein
MATRIQNKVIQEKRGERPTSDQESQKPKGEREQLAADTS